MSELFFTLKCLILTSAIVLFSQVKVGGESLENRASGYLQHSSVGVYLQGVAAGGALATVNFFKSTKNAVTGTLDSYEQGAREQKAGR